MKCGSCNGSGHLKSRKILHSDRPVTDDIEEMRALRDLGFTYKQIGEALDRRVSVVYGALNSSPRDLFEMCGGCNGKGTVRRR